MEREKLIFVDNSYNVYVGGVGESLQRNCRVRLRYYWAGLKALPCRIYKPLWRGILDKNVIVVVLRAALYRTTR